MISVGWDVVRALFIIILIFGVLAIVGRFLNEFICDLLAVIDNYFSACFVYSLLLYYECFF